MPESQFHRMSLHSIQASGAEEWICTTCGRRVMLRWSPVVAKTVIEPGDERVVHVGAAEAAPATPSATATDESSAVSVEPDRWWRDWLWRHGILWDDQAA